MSQRLSNVIIDRFTRYKAVGEVFEILSGLYLFKWKFIELFLPYPRKVGHWDEVASLHLVHVMLRPLSYCHVPSNRGNRQLDFSEYKVGCCSSDCKTSARLVRLRLLLTIGIWIQFALSLKVPLPRFNTVFGRSIFHPEFVLKSRKFSWFPGYFSPISWFSWSDNLSISWFSTRKMDYLKCKFGFF